MLLTTRRNQDNARTLRKDSFADLCMFNKKHFKIYLREIVLREIKHLCEIDELKIIRVHSFSKHKNRIISNRIIDGTCQLLA